MPRRVFRRATAPAAASGVFFAKNRKIQEGMQPMGFQKGESGNPNGRRRGALNPQPCWRRNCYRHALKVLLTSSLPRPCKTTAGRHAPLFPIDPNNGLINCSVYYVQFGEQQPAHLAVKWICARAVEHVMPGLAA
jgi:hypothetical protein